MFVGVGKLSQLFFLVSLASHYVLSWLRGKEIDALLKLQLSNYALRSSTAADSLV